MVCRMRANELQLIMQKELLVKSADPVVKCSPVVGGTALPLKDPCNLGVFLLVWAVARKVFAQL